MTTETMHSDILDVDGSQAAEVPKITPNTVIETPLFDVTFKKFKIADAEINAVNGFIPIDIMTTIADKLCLHIADRIVAIQEKVCGDEAITDGKTTPMREMFDYEKCKLHETFSKDMDPKDVIAAETAYMTLQAYHACLKGIIEQYDERFPMATGALQFAYVGQAAAKQTGRTQGQITSAKEAVEFRLETNRRRSTIKQRVQNRRNGAKEIEAVGGMPW